MPPTKTNLMGGGSFTLPIMPIYGIPATMNFVRTTPPEAQR